MKHTAYYRTAIPTLLSLSLLSACNSDNTIYDDTDEQGKTVEVSVIDYNPAPGQFINELPQANASTTKEQIISACNNSLKNGNPVSLGALGGNITLKTARPLTGKFQVIGNAISTSAEPGIISISSDGTKFYELKGEFFGSSKTVTVTYYKPSESTPNENHIMYSVSTGESGYIPLLPAYHNHTYFPLWVNSETLSFTCRMLPPNGHANASGIYVLDPYLGYADSYPNNSTNSIVDPANAIDESGNPVSIKSFSYIRISTGVIQVNGEIGECSTEICGIKAY